MYQSFSVISIEPSFAEKSIMIHTSFDIDPTSVNEKTVKVYSKFDGTDSSVEYKVNKKSITILLKDEIVPNTDYILRITNEVKNILGDGLESGVRRKIVFSSGVREIPQILSPSNFEEISNLKVALTTLKEDEEVEDSEDNLYFIQIAKDVAFINIVFETTIEDKIADLKDLPIGQYYIRARVEQLKDGKRECGKWSETNTFVSTRQIVDDTEYQPEPEPDEPEYIEEIVLIDKPVNGETPESIIFEFSGEIDPEFIENIVVIRRDI